MDPVEEIKSRLSIEDVVGRVVDLKRSGSSLKGLCPFHGEKTPSFHVHPDRGFFKCFGCGAGGDVITFVCKLENLTFPEAARMLAQRAGIELEPETPQSARVRSERESIYEANSLAAEFFEKAVSGMVVRRDRMRGFHRVEADSLGGLVAGQCSAQPV